MSILVIVDLANLCPRTYCGSLHVAVLLCGDLTCKAQLACCLSILAPVKALNDERCQTQKHVYACQIDHSMWIAKNAIGSALDLHKDGVLRSLLEEGMPVSVIIAGLTVLGTALMLSEACMLPL